MNHFGKYLAVIGVLTVGLLSGVAATSTQAVAELPRPMDAYVGFRHNPELEIAIFNNEETRRQASIQECMQRWECPLDLAPPRSLDLAPPVGCVVTEGSHFVVPVLVVRSR